MATSWTCKFIPSVLLLAAALGPTRARAVTQYRNHEQPFVFDIQELHPSVSLASAAQDVPLPIPAKAIIQRVVKSPKDVTIEPVELFLPHSERALQELAKKIAKPGRYNALLAYLHAHLNAMASEHGAVIHPSLALDVKGLRLVDPAALGRTFTQIHHEVTIDSEESDADARSQLVRQASLYLSPPQLSRLETKLDESKPVSVDTDLLPDFARKMVRKYTIYRGPNCFHAALAFQSPQLPASAFINVKREEGYHRAMINYDELWRALNMDFYEVDPRVSALDYGDIVVFFDVPANYNGGPIDFHWIHHAATYLFGNYTFSKGSKSPDTPYSVKTLAEEWQTWRHWTKHLGVKVFRKSAKNVTTQPPLDLTDWLY